MAKYKCKLKTFCSAKTKDGQCTLTQKCDMAEAQGPACDPIVFEMAMFYCKPPGTIHNQQEKLDWVLAAIEFIEKCDDTHYGDECVLCMSA
jgi:hypothetical protein